ncbi:WD40-repeat-containing domain protein [Aspergillus unguis]
MGSSLQHVDACLPVNTLEVFDLGEASLVLLGQGTFARLVDERSGKVLSFLDVFKINHIHGYTVLWKENKHVQLLAWGGQSLRLIDLEYSISSSGEVSVSLTAASAEYLAPDWVLAGCAPNTDGSAAYVVTAHNAVLGVSVVEDASSKYGKSIHLRQLVVGVKSILYSAQIVPISSSNLLVAAGTVFGEIIVWSCFLRKSQGSTADAVSSIHHFFTGHEGSIFDVEISPEIPNLRGDLSGRVLASCSDDRTVRIWDISDCGDASYDQPSAYSTDGFELRSTGFGHVKDKDSDSKFCVANAFGHGARIWGVHFLPEQLREGRISLVSRGEDTQCLVWDLSWDQSTDPRFKLTNTTTLRTHNGKHIWSLGLCTTGTETTVYTGGNDGAVRTFQLVLEAGELICPNRTARIDTAKWANANGKGTVMRSYEFVTPDCFLATTTSGEVQIAWSESANAVDRRIAHETLFVEEDLASYSIIAGFPSHGIALIGSKHGLIRLFDHEAKSLTSLVDVGQRPVGLYSLDYLPGSSNSPAVVSFLTTYVKLDTAELFRVNISPGTESVEKVTLQIPEGFEISAASLVHNNKYLALGSRYGTLVVYDMETTGSLEPLIKVVRVHSKDGITNIIPFPSLSADNTPSTYFISCGRDGTYRVNELEILTDSVSLRTIHSPTTVGFNVEGAYIDKSSQDLILYGFGGMGFIVWNETTQSEVAKIHCGGGHRRWAFHPSDRPGEALLIWSQNGFNACHINANATRSIRAGAHGREIKALGAHQPSDGTPPLFVTGSEDTTLRILTLKSPQRSGPWGALESVRVLTGHDSAPQHIAWSSNGQYLFTSSAMEDFFVWRIRSIPLFGVAAALQGWCPKSNPKSELRVTSFDILDVEDTQGQAEASFLLCLTYSNSTINVFHLSCANDDGHFTLLASGTYTSNCLTEVRFLRTESSLCLITTSTDGHFTLWDLTTVLEQYYNFDSTLSLKQPLTSISTEENIVCESRHQIHSNSIKSLEMVRLSTTTTLLLAGGDDNAITLSLLHTDPNLDTSARASTITIPDAHTASVNAVKVIENSITSSNGTTQLSFASSGNDHRVKLWRVEIDMRGRLTLDAIQVHNLLDRYSPVADISSLEVVSDHEGLKVLVCGVGMEVFRLDL